MSGKMNTIDLEFLARAVVKNEMEQMTVCPNHGYAAAAKRLHAAGYLIKDPNELGYVPSDAGIRLCDVMVTMLQGMGIKRGRGRPRKA